MNFLGVFYLVMRHLTAPPGGEALQNEDKEDVKTVSFVLESTDNKTQY